MNKFDEMMAFLAARVPWVVITSLEIALKMGGWEQLGISEARISIELPSGCLT